MGPSDLPSPFARVRSPGDERGGYSDALLSYVEKQAGPDGLSEVLVRAALGEARRDEVLAGGNLRTEELMDCYEAAARVCGDADLGRRVGEELFRIHRADGIAEVLLAQGGIEPAFQLVLDSGNSIKRSRQMHLIESGDQRLIIEARYGEGARVHPLFCGIARGYYAALPGLFGAEATIGEPVCVLDGATCCRYRIQWSAAPDEGAAAVGAGVAVRRRRPRAAGFSGFVEELLATAAELAVAPDLATLLDRIAESAGVTMAVSEFVVAVRLTDDGPLDHAHRGFPDDEQAGRAAAELMAGHGTETWPCGAAVDIVSPSRRYGRLAAYFPAEAPHELVVGTLEAYAGVARATIERLRALDSAASDRDTARSLLELAGALAGAADTDEVVDRLAAAVAQLTGCDHATVWRWDAARWALDLASMSSPDPLVVLPHPSVIVHDRTPEQVREFTENRRPTVMDAATATGSARRNLDAAGVATAFVVPIVVRSELLGVAIAGFRHPHQPTETLLAAMAGITDQASTALDNARLLEQVRRQARQDSLTGLANRGAIEDEARAGLAGAFEGDAPVALLFVDLDRFKEVNDTYGHHAGDDLIRQVASRLAACVRERDSVGRLGGDEFLVLCRDVVDASVTDRVTARIGAALSAPFVVQGEPVFVSCSIGTAMFPEHGTDYESLLRSADAAMYRAKAGAQP